MEILTSDDFKPMEGQAFQMIFDEGPALDLILSKIEASKICDFPGKTRDPFSLFFDGTKGVHCPQGNYRLRHESGWEVVMFMVPIGHNPDGTFCYQSVYN